MPGNEYDELLMGEKPADAGNEYVSMLNEEQATQKSNVQHSMFVASKVMPDRAAKVQDLSQRMNLPPTVVERNFDKIQGQHEQTDYDDLIKRYPGTSKWLEDPANSTVASDDLDSIRGIEDDVKEYGLLSSSYRALNVGLAKMYSSAAGIPATVTNAALLPYNATVSRVMDRPDLQISFPASNPISRYYDRQAERLAHT